MEDNISYEDLIEGDCYQLVGVFKQLPDGYYLGKFIKIRYSIRENEDDVLYFENLRINANDIATNNLMFQPVDCPNPEMFQAAMAMNRNQKDYGRASQNSLLLQNINKYFGGKRRKTKTYKKKGRKSRKNSKKTRKIRRNRVTKRSRK